MSSFTYGPVVRPHPNKARLFVIEQCFEYYRESETIGPKVIIEVGALTNGASVPWFLRPIFPQWHPDYSAAATMHDVMVGEFGQAKAFIHEQGKVPRHASWNEAALWFREGMKVKGAPAWKQSIFYHAVMLNKKFKKTFK